MVVHKLYYMMVEKYDIYDGYETNIKVGEKLDALKIIYH